MATHIRAAAAATMILVAAACGGSNDSSSTGPATPPKDSTSTTTGAFTLAATPTSASIAQGGTTTVTITIARTGSFVGAVALSVTTPTGLSATLSSSSVTGNSATLTLTATSTIAVGSQSISIKGTGGVSITDQTVTLPVSITAASGSSSGNVTLKFCDFSGTLPIWVAAQDGTGAWRRVTGANSSYSFNVGTRGAFAYVTPVGSDFTLRVTYGTLAELQAYGLAFCPAVSIPGKTVTAPVVGASDQFVSAQLSSVGLGSYNQNTSTVTLPNVQDGVHDLLATNFNETFTGSTFLITLDKMLIRRGLNPADGSALAPLDFNGSEAFAPVNHTVTFANLGSDQTFISMSYVMANHDAYGYYTGYSAAGGSRTYPGVPAATQVSSDLHVLTAIAEVSASGVGPRRTVDLVFKDAIDRTVTFGPALSTPTVTTLSGGYGRVRAVVAAQAEYGENYDLLLAQDSPTRSVIVIQSVAYGGGSTSTIELPDLSGVNGFDPNWGLKIGTVTTWTLIANGWTSSGAINGPTFVEGAVISNASQMGQITP